MLVDEEGEVLRAYRCPAGRWTIGVGLTAASGVVVPKSGMVITKEESQRLLQRALQLNYEPAVEKAMGKPRQAEFDAGVGFHFNTGAIARATWVKLWRKGGAPWGDIRRALLAWNRGGGKVLPGLTSRRKREFDMLKDGTYPGVVSAPQAPRPANEARFVVPMEPMEIAAVRDSLVKLGYPAGHYKAAVAETAVRAFQRDHGLTDDGIVGRATLSTLQRMIDARSKAAPAVALPAAAGAGTATGADQTLTGIPYSGEILIGLSLIYVLYLGFSYRDAIAAKVQRKLPGVAAILRRF